MRTFAVLVVVCLGFSSAVPDLRSAFKEWKLKFPREGESGLKNDLMRFVSALFVGMN